MHEVHWYSLSMVGTWMICAQIYGSDLGWFRSIGMYRSSTIRRACWAMFSVLGCKIGQRKQSLLCPSCIVQLFQSASNCCYCSGTKDCLTSRHLQLQLSYVLFRPCLLSSCLLDIVPPVWAGCRCSKSSAACRTQLCSVEQFHQLCDAVIQGFPTILSHCSCPWGIQFIWSGDPILMSMRFTISCVASSGWAEPDAELRVLIPIRSISFDLWWAGPYHLFSPIVAFKCTHCHSLSIKRSWT